MRIHGTTNDNFRIMGLIIEDVNSVNYLGRIITTNGENGVRNTE